MVHEGVARLLLEPASAKPDGTDGWWGKNPRLVKKVQGNRYVNSNWPDKHGRTPLVWAVIEG